jgi:DNA polymerase II small subunit
MSTDLNKTEISKRFNEEDIFILPEAADEILNSSNPDGLIENIIKNFDSGETLNKEKIIDFISEDEGQEKDGLNVIENDNIESDNGSKNHNFKISNIPNGSNKRDIVEGQTIDSKEAFNKIKNSISETKDADQVINRKDTLENRYPEWYDIMFNRELPESQKRIDTDSNYDIYGDITGESRGQGEFDDFQNLFEDRYDKMVNLLDQRVGGARHVSDIHPRRHGGEQLTIVGLVWSKNVSKNGNYFIDIEDPSTNELLTVGWTDDEIKETFEEVVEDEVIAIRGNLSDDGDILWGDDEVRRGRPPIMFPEVPRRKNRNSPNRPIKAAMLSDIHVGADEFYPEYWNKFVDWIREDPTVKYLFVAGDLVEGVGVYPDQDEELRVLDIHDQYAMAGKMFEQIPDDVQIFASVGNHDTVRLAEPQPTLPEKFREYFPENVEFVGNPVTIEVNNIRVLMYHGMSINALSEVIPGLDPENPIPIMELMLKKRHVAPVYGKNVRLAPEEKDYLVIEKVPDILHCGHVHKYGQDSYNGVKMVNTAGWQGQTSFQKSKGIDPEVGYWAVMNLSNRDVEKYTVDDV